VHKITLLKSVNKDFNKAAIEAIKKSKFSPARVGGKSVAVCSAFQLNLLCNSFFDIIQNFNNGNLINSKRKPQVVVAIFF